MRFVFAKSKCIYFFTFDSIERYQSRTGNNEKRENKNHRENLIQINC